MRLQDLTVWFAVAALTLTLAPFAHAGLSNQTKCDSGKLLAAAKFSQCRIKVDFIALKKGDKLSAEKKAAMEGKCDIKLNAAFVKLEGMYPDAGDDRCSTYGDAANMIAGLVAMSDAVADGSISAEGSDALDPLSNDEQVEQAHCEELGGEWVARPYPMGGFTMVCSTDEIEVSDNQEVCEAAGGAWDGSMCTPAAEPDRDCFREGLCGSEGYDLGLFVGTTKASLGCDASEYASYSYDEGWYVADLSLDHDSNFGYYLSHLCSLLWQSR